jgi:NADH dehydrogenase/NADH:ubiquinone oxidoreductase subunit G
VSYKEGLENQMQLSKNMFSSFMEDMFGGALDLDDLDMNDPESMAEYEVKMKALFEENFKSNSTSKKKTKKQIEKENQQKAEELAQNKSLRSIYISLTKVLHPDRETDEKLKKEKEEIMKTVTSAYESKDLSALLKLEMEWVFKTKEHLEKLADDKLNVYISVLKDRVSELEQEKFMIYRNPRLQNIAEYVDLKEVAAVGLMKKEELGLRELIEDFKGDISMTLTMKSKSTIIELIDDFHEVYCGDSYEFDMFNDEDYW